MTSLPTPSETDTNGTALGVNRTESGMRDFTKEDNSSCAVDPTIDQLLLIWAPQTALLIVASLLFFMDYPEEDALPC